MKNVGFFGGSFDPPHLGHRSLAISFLESGMLDELWVMPTPVPPHKPNENRTDYKLRFEMAALTFKGIHGCVVSDFEKSLEPPHYTIHSLNQLQKKYPDNKFHLCMGQDSVNSIYSWYRGEELLHNYPVLVAKRPGEKGKKTGGKVTYVTHEPIDVSATSVREAIKQGDKIWKSWVVPEVSGLIDKHELYRN